MAHVADGELWSDAGSGASFYPLCARGTGLSRRTLSQRDAAPAPRPQRPARRSRLSGGGIFNCRHRGVALDARNPCDRADTRRLSRRRRLVRADRRAPRGDRGDRRQERREPVERAPGADRGAMVEFVREKYRSEEHTSELQSLKRISYAAFWLTTTNR